jgi:hypothetical protein
MCLTNEVRLESLKIQFHGQVGQVDVFSHLIHNSRISASKFGLRRNYLPSGSLCTLVKSMIASGLFDYLFYFFLILDHQLELRYKNEKTDPDLFMDSDPDDDDIDVIGSGPSDLKETDVSASSAADMARAYHKARAGKPIVQSKSFSLKWDLILLLYSWMLVLLCPYTKVEESFNMQAMHDIIFHRHNVEAYDHLVFTGPVPRTMLGSVIVSTASSPIAVVMSLMNAPNWTFAYLVRMVLASFLVASMSFLRVSVHKRYDAATSWWLGFVNLMQFHIPFYISRSLPNTYALFFTNMALGCILQQQFRYSIALLTASAVIFRSDTLVFAAPFMLSLLISRNLTFSRFLATGLTTAVPCISISVAVDSFFWRRLLWPEALVFLFNTVQNKSAEWGTSPWHW